MSGGGLDCAVRRASSRGSDLSHYKGTGSWEGNQRVLIYGKITIAVN